MKKKLLILLTLLSVVCWVTAASAVPLLQYTDPLFGSTADFSITAGGQLQIVLTSNRVASKPGDVLTALFFTSSDAFTPVSANLTAGSAIIIGTGPGAKPTDTTQGSNVGGEWEYLKVATALGNQGISSSKLGFFKTPNFNGPNLQGPAGVDGGQFGIVNGESSPKGGFKKDSEVNKSVTFLLNVASGFALSDITNPQIWYGTGHVPSPPPAPIPPTVLLLGSGLVGLGFLAWRQKKS